jgi:uncharacterized protein YacL
MNTLNDFKPRFPDTAQGRQTQEMLMAASRKYYATLRNKQRLAATVYLIAVAVLIAMAVASIFAFMGTPLFHMVIWVEVAVVMTSFNLAVIFRSIHLTIKKTCVQHREVHYAVYHNHVTD